MAVPLGGAAAVALVLLACAHRAGLRQAFIIILAALAVAGCLAVAAGLLLSRRRRGRPASTRARSAELAGQVSRQFAPVPPAGRCEECEARPAEIQSAGRLLCAECADFQPADGLEAGRPGGFDPELDRPAGDGEADPVWADFDRPALP
jgi:hypothetical protein